MIKRETIIAGSTGFIRIAGVADKTISGKRKSKQKPTPEAVKEINRIRSERSLQIKINYNFKPGDIHLVLTYAKEEPTKAEAAKELRNFKDRLRRLYKKNNIEFKWICVTEYLNKRIHHHMIVPNIDASEIDKLWIKGYIRPVYLDSTGDYRKLASYLVKETDKTFRNADAASKQRFSCSRNIKNPPVKVERVSASALVRDPKPPKGYSIDEDSLYRGINPVTGVPYMEYVIVSMLPVPRLSIWPRGVKKKYKEKYYDKLLKEISEYQTRFVFDDEEDLY